MAETKSTCFCGEIIVKGKPCRCQRENPRRVAPAQADYHGGEYDHAPITDGWSGDKYDRDPWLEDYEMALVGWSDDTERY